MSQATVTRPMDAHKKKALCPSLRSLHPNLRSLTRVFETHLSAEGSPERIANKTFLVILKKVTFNDD